MAIKKNETMAPEAAPATAPTATKKQQQAADGGATSTTTTTAKQQQQKEKPQQQEKKGGAASDANNGSSAADTNGENNGVAPENTEQYKEFVVMQEQITAMNNAIKVFTQALKEMNKKYTKALKAGQKKQKKGGDANGNKRTNGFSLPVKLSDDMCKFLGVPPGTQMGRTDVTKTLTKYVKDNGLHDKQDKRNIIPDAKLKAILGPTDDGKPLSYFNLQKSIKHHFIKENTAPPAAAAAGK